MTNGFRLEKPPAHVLENSSAIMAITYKCKSKKPNNRALL